jgi:hypothetical protein
MFMASRLRIAVLFFVACLVVVRAIAQDVSNLWTNNPRIRIARFHVLFIYAFPENEARATKQRLDDIFSTFNGDVHTLSQDPRFTNFEVQHTVDSKAVSNRAEFDNELLKLEADVKKASNLGLISAREKSDLPDDVVFVYVLTHGFKDPQGKVQLQIGNGTDTVDRNDLERRMEKLYTDKLARFVVLITDNCVPSSSKAPPRQHDSSAKGGIWRGLYFGHTGFVHLSTAAAAKNQYAFLAGSSLFAIAFDNALSTSSIVKEHPEIVGLPLREQLKVFVSLLDTKGDGVTSWAKFKGHLQTQLSNQFDSELKYVPSNSDMAVQGGQEIDLVDHSHVNTPDNT